MDATMWILRAQLKPPPSPALRGRIKVSLRMSLIAARSWSPGSIRRLGGCDRSPRRMWPATVNGRAITYAQLDNILRLSSPAPREAFERAIRSRYRTR